MTLRVQSFEFFCGFVQLNLGSLCLSDFLLEFVCFLGNLNGKFLNLEGKLLDLGLIGSSVLLQGEVVFFLLSGGKSPLLQLLLIPVHFELELVHALVGLEDHVLDIVETVLLVGDTLLQLLNLVLETATLTLSDLLHVLLRFNFLVLGIHQALGVNKLHLDRFEMFLKNLQTLLMLLNFQSQLGDKADLLPDYLIQLLILVVGIWWEVLVQVILRNSINNVVCHTSFF